MNMDRREPNPDIIGINQKLMLLAEKVDVLDRDFRKHEEVEAEKFDKMIDAVDRNSEVMVKQGEKIDSLVENTAGIIQVHNDIKGTMRVGKFLQNGFIWIIKWGSIGTALWYVAEWFKSNH